MTGGLCVRFVRASLALPAVEVAADGADGAFAAEVAYPQTSVYEIVPVGTYGFRHPGRPRGRRLTVPGVVF